MGFSGSALGQLVNILPIPRPADAGKVLMAIGAGTAGWASTTSLVTDAVKISPDDTTSAYLASKLVAGAGIGLVTLNPSLNETLQILNLDAGSTAVAQHLIDTPHLVLGTESGLAFDGALGLLAYDHSRTTFGNPHNVTAGQIGLDQVTNTSDVNKPVSSAQAEAMKLTQAGPVTSATVTDHNAGVVDVSGLTARFNTAADFSGSYVEVPVAALNGIHLVANQYTYVIASYNGGAPVYSTTLDNKVVNHSTVLNIVQLYWEKLNAVDHLHVFYTGMYGLGLTNKITHRLIHTERFGWEMGLALSESGTRNVVTSAGRIWYDGQSYDILAANTVNAGEEAYQYFHVGGVWNVLKVNTYNNTQYDNGTALASVSVGNYAVNWIYRCVDNAEKITFIVLGKADYNLTQASASLPPTGLPDLITKQATLVGRVIVLQGAPTATVISSAFSPSYPDTAFHNHNDLSLIQGGGSADYQHLTTAQVSALHAAVTLGTGSNGLSLAAGQVLSLGLASAGVTGALSGTDWSTFSGKQGTLITGMTAADGTILATDTIIQAFGKLARVPQTDASNQALTAGFVATSVIGALNETRLVNTVTCDPTGVETSSAITLAWVDGTKTVTASPTAVNYRVWVRGKPIVISTNRTWTIPAPLTAGLYYLWLDSTGAAVISQSFWDLSAVVPIASVYWDGAKGTMFDERHGIAMDWATHVYLHTTVGTRFVRGFGLDGYAAGVYSDAATQVQVHEGVIADEDLRTTIGDTGDPGSLSVWYRAAGGTSWTWDAASTFQVKQAAGVPKIDVVGTQTSVLNGYYFNQWFFATNAIAGSSGMLIVQGQAQFASVTLAAAENLSSLSFADLELDEMSPLWRITYQYSAGAGGTANVRIVSSALPLDLRGTSSPAAGMPAGQHSALAGRSDIASHPATAIVTDTTNFNGVLTDSETSVQSALDKIDDLLASTNTKGFLSSTDWNTFYNKQATVSISGTPNGLAINSAVLSIGLSSAIATGALSSTDWGNFNTAYSERKQWDGGNTNLVAATGRSSLGLGSAAQLTAGVAANNAVQLDGSAFLPAVNGSALTNLTATNVGGFTQGSVAFAGGTGFLAQDNATFFWDTTNKRLGLGVATPATRLHVRSAAVGSVVSTIQGLLNQTSDLTQWQSSTNAVLASVGALGQGSFTGMSQGIRTVTSAPTLIASDCTVLCDATSAGFTVALPAAATSSGRMLVIKKIDASANVVVIDANASETIDGALTVSIAARYNSFTLHCDGSAWYVI